MVDPQYRQFNRKRAGIKLVARLLVGLALAVAVLHLRGLTDALAATLPNRPELPDFDVRTHNAPTAAAMVDHSPALASLKAVVPDVEVDFDEITGSPSWIRSEHGFLAGTNGGGGISARVLA